MNPLIALQEVAPTLTVPGTDWNIIIPAIVAGLVTLIGSITAAIIAWNTNKKTNTIKEDGVKRDEKLGRIEVLVDGRYGQVLQELADVKLLLATTTGLKTDSDRASQAQTAADNQIARTTAITNSKSSILTEAEIPITGTVTIDTNSGAVVNAKTP